MKSVKIQKKEKVIKILLRLPESLMFDIAMIAAACDLTHSEAIRRILALGIDQHLNGKIKEVSKKKKVT